MRNVPAKVPVNAAGAGEGRLPGDLRRARHDRAGLDVVAYVQKWIDLSKALVRSGSVFDVRARGVEALSRAVDAVICVVEQAERAEGRRSDTVVVGLVA